MDEELQEKLIHVLNEMLDTMTDKGVDDEGTSKLTTNFAKLYELYQKDIDSERKHDENHEKMAYENGRLDMELEAKVQAIKNELKKLELEERRLNLDEKKIETDVAIAQERLKSERANTAVLAVAKGVGMGFKIWLSSCLMHYDASGHVVGTLLGKKTLDRWATADEHF